jgi:hypothetical protein
MTSATPSGTVTVSKIDMVSDSCPSNISKNNK